MQADVIRSSSLRSWYRCKLQYRFAFHDCIEIAGPKGPSLEFGSYIHKVFERAVAENKDPWDIAKEEISNYQFPIKMNARVPQIIRNWLAFMRGLEGHGRLEFVTERQFKADLGDGITLQGTIDLIVEFVDSGKKMIVDYKTNQSFEKSKQEASTDEQMLLYPYLLSVNTNTELSDIFCVLFYVQSGNKPVIRPDRQRILAMVESAKKTAFEIRNTPPDKAKPSPNRLCGWCAYKDICPGYAKWRDLTGKE